MLFILPHLQCTMNRWASLVKNLGRTSQILERLLYSFSLIPNTLHFVATWSHSPSLRISATIPIVDIGVILGSAISHKLYLKIQLQHTICLRAIQIKPYVSKKWKYGYYANLPTKSSQQFIRLYYLCDENVYFPRILSVIQCETSQHINDNMRFDYHIFCGTNPEFEHNAEFGYEH